MWTTSKYVIPEHVKIDEISPEMNGEVVTVSGEVSQFSRTDDTVFFKIEDGTGKIDIVEFRSELENLNGNTTVEGTVGIYRGNLQIVAEEIRQ